MFKKIDHSYNVSDFFPLFLNASSLNRYSFYQPVFVSDNLLLLGNYRTPLLTVINENNFFWRIETTIRRKSIRQRQMDLLDWSLSKDTKKIGCHRFFPKVRWFFFLMLFSSSFRVMTTYLVPGLQISQRIFFKL